MVSLWTKSHCSFLEGASSPEELMAEASALGLQAVALTDRNGLYGMVRAHRAASTLGIKLIVGAELSLSATTRVVLLAADAQGYAKLCQLITLAHVDHPKGSALLPLEALCAALAETGELLCLCPHPELLPRLAASGRLRRRLYGLCARAFEAHEAQAEAAMERMAESLQVPIVAAVEVLYHRPERRALQDILTCIRYNTTLQQADLRLRSNAEHALIGQDAWAARFADRPDWVKTAKEVAARCHFSLSALRYHYPTSRLPPGIDAHAHLRNRVLLGAHRRYGPVLTAKVQAQLDRELQIIVDLDYGGYFLSMEDIVLFCTQNGILCQGRGSAANSMVCYCLGITAVDPDQMELLFERFLSRARAEPPDIDLDIEHHRREEVIQWVYAQYGRRHAAMVANVVRFRMRSAIRSVGAALALDKNKLDALARQVGLVAGSTSPQSNEGFIEPIAWHAWLAQAGFDPQCPQVQHLVRLSMSILDVPRHLSVHPGGFLLGEAPVDTLCAVEPASMPGRTVVQWDKQDIEDMGLFKVDLLGLGALSHIHESFKWIARTEHKTLTMASVPQEDPATYAMIQQGDTLGVFQIESRAQMAMLPRLRPKTFYDLVVEVAIVRPGPIQGDMVHPYLRARQLGVRPDYPHPAFAAILDKTFGVPIFQEQVMRLAILAADYTPDEADLLRRDMAAWRSQERLEAHHTRIVAGMQRKGVPQAFAERIFAQIRGFGEYGFPESHAASFAHIVYVTAYLRCRHKEAFTCGLLNAQPMGFYSPSTIIDDARRRGVRMLPIRVGLSGWNCEVVHDAADPHRLAVRMGLRYVHGFGVRERAILEQTRDHFASLADFVDQAPLHQNALCALARAGALDHLDDTMAAASAAPSGARRALLARLRGLVGGRHDTLFAARAGQDRQADPPTAAAPWHAPLDVGEDILWERRASGHSTTGHPMAALRRRLSQRGVLTAGAISGSAHGRKVVHGGFPICLQRPQTARGVTFLTLEDETGFVNIVIWLQVYSRYAQLIKTASALLVHGEVQRAGQVVHVMASHFTVL